MLLSLMLLVWNTSHLLARTLETLKKQTMEDWELIIIDDNSEDDVMRVLRQNGEGLPIKYHRLEHDMGMRGNTTSLNYGLSHATGDVVMWSTPEVMLPSMALGLAYATHITRPDELLFVTIPSHGLTADLQLRIDEVDWRSDLRNLHELALEFPSDHWSSVWFYLNFFEHGRRDGLRKTAYGNNQTVAVDRQRWLQEIGTFPLFCDYGSDDPWLARERKQRGYADVTLWEQAGYHQWHTTSQYWIALGKAPNWNVHGHTINNMMGDSRVPKGGTCQIWDGGSHKQFTEEKAAEIIAAQGPMVHATGFKEKEK